MRPVINDKVENLPNLRITPDPGIEGVYEDTDPSVRNV